MSSVTAGRDNPFPVRAVTTFGLRAPVVAPFAYMARAREYLVDYLKGYPKSGAAIALSGGHGSGKTFLLNWLSNEAAGFTSRRTTTVYAKADNESVPDAYRQFMRSITRPALIEVTSLAVRNIGRRIAGAAQATRQTSLEIESAGTLKPGFDAKLFDANELYLLLKDELESIGVSPAISRRVAYAVGILDNAQFGEPAFAWLSGGPAELPKEMPIREPLWVDDSVDAGDIAVSALECVAGLYRLADIPLILILDQIENFIPRGDRAAAGASLLKKLAEQISAQSGLLVLAGTPPAWERLPRDVAPRLLTRTPLLVGGPNNEETALLLRSYLGSQQGFSPEAEIVIRDLSGGNIREILQIAHRVFEKAKGNLVEVSRDDLVQAAQDSGTLADRATLALQMIDAISERLKFSASAAATRQSRKIDRWVTGTQGSSLAIVLLTSPDALSEAEDARKLTELRKELVSEPGQPELLVVAVGYSSERVRALVGEISNVLVFDENRFQKQIEEAFHYLSVAAPAPARPQNQEMTELLTHLGKLDDRLARIEANRVEAEQQTASILQEGAEQLAKSERIQTEVKTRAELRFGLDELHEALTAGNQSSERRILRGLLVANEANVKDPVFDYLGTVYLDSLDSAEFARISESDFDSVRNFAALRSDLIRSMRNALSARQGGNTFLARPPVVSVVAGIIGAIAGSIFIRNNPFVLWFFAISFDNPSETLLAALVGGLLTGVLVGFLVFGTLDFLTKPQRRYARLVSKLDRLRASNGTSTVPSALPVPPNPTTNNDLSFPSPAAPPPP